MADNSELVLAWRDGAPPKPWSQEWFIADTHFGPAVLRALPDEWTYDFKTADETYIKADKIKRWMQFPNSHFIAPSISAREAAMKEALEDIVQRNEIQHWFNTDKAKAALAVPQS